MPILTIKLTIKPQKGPETSEPTGNVASSEISMGSERGKVKEHLYHIKQHWQVLTCPSWCIVFCQLMADCCGLL